MKELRTYGIYPINDVLFVTTDLFSFAIAGKKHISGTTRIMNDIVTNTISFILKPNDNGATYHCKAMNLATTTPLIQSVTLEVNCKYANGKLSIKYVHHNNSFTC